MGLWFGALPPTNPARDTAAVRGFLGRLLRFKCQILIPHQAGMAGSNADRREA